MTTFVYIFYLILMIIIFKKKPIIIIIFFIFLLNQFIFYTSVFYLDFGNSKMIELNEVSEKSNYSLFIFFWVSISLFIFYKYIKKKEKYLKKLFLNIRHIKIRNIQAIVLLIYFILLILILNIFISGSPLWVSTINKTTFWDIAKLKFLKPVSSQILFLSLVSGMLVVYVKVNKLKPILIRQLYFIWFLLVLYIVLMGHRFGQPLKITYLFFLPILLYSILSNKFKFGKIIINVLLIFSIIFLITLNYFKMKYGDYAFDMLEQRIFSMEGQLAYVALRDFLNGSMHINGFSELFNTLEYAFGIGDTNLVGMKFLMSQYMPSDTLNFYLDTKINLSNAYIALLIYYCAGNIVIMFIVNILIMFLLTYIIYLFIKSILKYDFIMVFLYSKIYFIIMSLPFSASLENIFTFKFILIIIIIVMIHLYREQKIYRKRVLFENTTHN